MQAIANDDTPGKFFVRMHKILNALCGMLPIGIHHQQRRCLIVQSMLKKRAQCSGLSLVCVVPNDCNPWMRMERAITNRLLRSIVANHYMITQRQNCRNQFGQRLVSVIGRNSNYQLSRLLL